MTRLIVFVVVIIAIVFGEQVLYTGLKYVTNVSDLLTLASAVMTVFGGIFTLAAGFKLFQKQMEEKPTTPTTP
jgi:hypothetical protein